MNLYHCMIDLKPDAKALNFAHALEKWMEFHRSNGTINGWRLLRRKLNLASDAHRDFMLEVEVDDLGQLDAAFRLISGHSDVVATLFGQISPMVEKVDYGLYRPFPDPERAERVALL